MIPLITSEAGQCLTMANWQEAGIQTVSCHLVDLLMKPGFDGLCAVPDLASYVGWSDSIVLNASMPNPLREGSYEIRSKYDGHRARYTIEDILTLISHLNPNYVALPEGLHQQHHTVWKLLPDVKTLFFSPDDIPDKIDNRSYGVYFYYDGQMPVSECLETIKRYRDLPCYVFGDLNSEVLSVLAGEGVEYLESDRPASDAFEGVLYHEEGLIFITAPSEARNFDPIHKQCPCATCRQGFSRAYLHHLFNHTPLLCQRLLIQHNVTYATLIG